MQYRPAAERPVPGARQTEGDAVNITITGAPGFIARNLEQALSRAGHSVRALSRAAWNVAEGEPPTESLAGADAIIYLAGEPGEQRWSRGAKRRIRDSRVNGTHHLATPLSTLKPRPA